MLDKPYIEEPDMSGLPDEEVAARTWANYRARNDSVMVDHFQARLALAPQSWPLTFPLHESAVFRQEKCYDRSSGQQHSLAVALQGTSV